MLDPVVPPVVLPVVPPVVDTKDAEIAELKKQLEALKKPTLQADDPSLADKARKEREDKEKKVSESKELEKAIAYTMSSKDWLKTNESILPKGIAGIFEQAEKENYDSALDKAAAIKVGVVSEFFSLQSNVDLLTETQKTILEDFKKLTKNDKQERIQSLYDTVFEPTFEGLKRIKKAAQLRSGEANSTDRESAHLTKMKNLSKKYYLKEKGDN